MEIVYFTDSGGGMDSSDFLQYLIWKIGGFINDGMNKEDAIRKVCEIFEENISAEMSNAINVRFK